MSSLSWFCWWFCWCLCWQLVPCMRQFCWWFCWCLCWQLEPCRRAASPLATRSWFAGMGGGHTLVWVAKLDWKFFKEFVEDEKLSDAETHYTCIACILPNCWDCSQSESRIHSRPKAILPTVIRKAWRAEPTSLCSKNYGHQEGQSMHKIQHMNEIKFNDSPEMNLISQLSFGFLADSEISNN